MPPYQHTRSRYNFEDGLAKARRSLAEAAAILTRMDVIEARITKNLAASALAQARWRERHPDVPEARF